MSPRIHFLGNAAACARWLPFAKSKLAELTKRYASRRHWTRELPVPGALVSLERAAGVSYIRIRAGGFGYEFATAFGTRFSAEGNYRGQLSELKLGLVVKRQDEAGEDRLEQRTRSGAEVQPGADGLENQKDAFLFGRQWNARLQAEEVPYTVPAMDWFQVPLPDPGEQPDDNGETTADRRARRGYSGSRFAITTPMDFRRHSSFSFVDALLGISVGGWNSPT